MPKVLFTTSTFNLENFYEHSILEQAGYELLINPYGKRLTEEQIDALLDDDVVGIVAGLEPLTASVLEKTKNLRVISRCGIGLDNVDLQAANLKGISVFNTPEAPTRSVAELTIAHILAFARRITVADQLIKQGQWKPVMGFLLARQTVGIMGYGRIGALVCQLLKAFGCRIIIFDPYITDSIEGIEFVSFDQLIHESDIITLHLPYSESTHHLIGKDQLEAMKENAFLVNIARGGLIDENALYNALIEGKIAGAALDCFEQEPYNGPLTKCQNIQMTAHMGSYAKEGRAMQEAEACVELMKGLRKHKLI
jgi:D-3-phosphoglycerate dehydrogenase